MAYFYRLHPPVDEKTMRGYVVERAGRFYAVIYEGRDPISTLGLRDAEESEAPLYWRSRAVDMKRILDQLDVIEASVPQLVGRLDRSKVAVVGHSMGAHTASLPPPVHRS